MTDRERQECVRAMLIRYRDALHEQKQGTNRADSLDSRMLLYPRAFNAAMRELDHCLASMRAQPYEVFRGSTLKTLRFHVIAYYVDVDYVQKPVYARKATKTGWQRTITGYRLEERRTNAADKPKADQGVHWLSQTYSWPNVHLKAIQEACGNTIAA